MSAGEVPVLSIILPAYNEAANIRKGHLVKLDEACSQLPYQTEVVVVDDGSEDDTADLLEQFAASHPGFSVIRNPHKGKAQAVSTAMLRARADFVLFMDMDIATSLDHIAPFVDVLRSGEAELVIASRELPGAVRLNSPWIRRFLGKGFNLIIRVLLLPGIRDTQCGFKAFRRDVALDLFGRSVVFSPTPELVRGPRVTAFDVELLVLAKRHGYRIKQIPVIWTHTKSKGVRVIGESTKMLREVLSIWRHDCRGGYNPNPPAGEAPQPAPRETKGQIE
ncbi:MAG TPA: dolichyl-phosphate beta-glucosyltransferase [Dehalococcoidia bacterium]|nr:dolichyl-phosphate beta-glucosyltransferase [Dehalococcoidia bacterium]